MRIPGLQDVRSTYKNSFKQPESSPLKEKTSNENHAPGPLNQGKLVLATLIIVAAVANLNLSVANVALPSIGAAFNASQVQINLVAIGYSLGLAASVLWFGALGDHHGRKMLVIAGTLLAIPASLLAGFAPNIEILIFARIIGGLAAGMAYPATLSLIAALWSGSERTRSIALWSGIGAAIAALGPLLSGYLLLFKLWGSVFLVTLPLAVVAVIMAFKFIPAHINETSKPVDNLGGVLSLIMLGALILAINFAPVPNETTLVLGLTIFAVVAGVFFIIRQRRITNPLYDLRVASRRIFWVAACGGIIVFGSLMGAMYIGQQFLQNILAYSTLDSGISILPAAILMILVAPHSAKLVESRGSRFTLLVGYLFCLLGFLTMLLLWEEGIPYWKVGLAYALVGIGVGFAGTPASHSLTGSVPVKRVGMASGTADLQRDFGGAIMTSIFGALLTAGYAKAFAAKISDIPAAEQQQISSSVIAELQKSFSSADAVAQHYPQYSAGITAAAKSSFLSGDHLSYIAGIIAILIGAAIIYFKFPKKDEEQELLAQYQAEDVGMSED
ncbi:MAG TPA: MFS transporter [Methanobacteriaceae archaeon]|nr:MFS transporter [Methanobacteriaceae archaeon]